MKTIPGFDLKGAGPPLHFLHANGYPPECYRPLLDLLQTQYHVFGMLLRPLWPGSDPKEVQDWKPFSEDLLQFLGSSTTRASRSASNKPVIGVGHSIGAIVTLRAALRDPGKFKALVLIDPVLFVPSFLLQWNIVLGLGMGNRLHPLITGARKRRRTFDDLETILRGYRSRSVFRYLSDESLRAYVEGMTRKTERGFELVYSPEWEAHIYLTGMRDFDVWRDLPKLAVPTLFLRGAETDTFLEKAAKLVQRKQPRAQVETVDKSTHLLPLERPREVFERMQLFLQSLESASLSKIPR